MNIDVKSLSKLGGERGAKNDKNIVAAVVGEGDGGGESYLKSINPHD